jgi:hypothetical protein
MSAIDVHAHVIVPELLRDAAPAEDWRPSIRREAGRQVVELAGRSIASAVEEFVELDQILAGLQRREVDRVLLCPWVALLFFGVEGTRALAGAGCRTRGSLPCAPGARIGCACSVRCRCRTRRSPRPSFAS